MVAPSSVVPLIELSMGVATLEAAGFEVRVHPHVYRQDLFYAGTHEERAEAFAEFVLDPSIDVVWCARGGSGAFEVIQAVHPIFQKQSKKLRALARHKQIMGYSDITSLLEYMNAQWGWRAIHCPMPTAREFSVLPSLKTLLAVAKGKPLVQSHRLTWVSSIRPSPSQSIRGPLVGGNLTVWSTLVGTEHQGRSKGCVLFFEEITEAWYRIDRMMTQMHAAGAFDGVKAMVLGTFTDCPDPVMSVLDETPEGGLSPKNLSQWLKAEEPRKRMRPIRKSYPVDFLQKEVFARWSERLGIPIAIGLPCGHGTAGFEPLEFGVKVELNARGVFKPIRPKTVKK